MKNRDLTLAFLWALVMLLTVLVIDSSLLRLIVAAPLVLFLSGHAVLRAIGYVVPSLLEHSLYSIGASIAITVLGGFLLNFVSLLTPIGWAFWFVAITGLAVTKTRSSPTPWPIPGFPEIRRGHVVGLGLALAITTIAYLLAVYDEANQHEFVYTEFWMLPNPGKLLVGIRSGELETQRFDVEVTAGETLLAQWNGINVAPGDTWTKQVDLSVGASYKAEAKLYRTPDHAIYRKVSAITFGE